MVPRLRRFRVMTSHELFATMPPALAAEILDFTFSHDRPLYHAALEAVAQARKVRPVFFERQPRAARDAIIRSTLARPPLEPAADSLIRNWLLKGQTSMLVDFLDALKIVHQKGVVENLPTSVDDTLLRAAVEQLLGKYPRAAVVLYLRAFHAMNDVRWVSLEDLLQTDSRLEMASQASAGRAATGSEPSRI